MRRVADEPDLQHEAEHTRAEKPHSATRYLILLVVTAFLLLLMSYLMQRRTNQAALNSLQSTSNSAMETIENMMADRDALRDKVDELEDETADLRRQLQEVRQEAAAARQETLDAQGDVQALTRLNQLRALYNAKKFQAARELLETWEKAAPGDLEKRLAAISSALTPQEREIYDPLDAYRKLVKWLG